MKKILSFILILAFAVNVVTMPISAMTEIDTKDEQKQESNISDSTQENSSNDTKETLNENTTTNSDSEQTQYLSENENQESSLTKGIDTAPDDPEQFRANGEISQDFNPSVPQTWARGFQTKSPYTSKTYTHNSKFEDDTIIHGIDVSVWNNTINWQKVKNDGIDFAFIRVAARGYGSSGNIFDDSKFKTNITNAKKYGVKVGVYFFSQAITTKEAREEANYTLRKIKGYSLDMPVIMDYEYSGGSDGRLTNAKLTNTQRTNIVMEFCKTIKEAGYTPMVYANYSMLTYDLNKSTIDSSYKVWLAHYATSTSYRGDYEFWQYSSKGSVSGISGNVDVNFWYKEKQASTIPKLTFSSSTSSSIKLTWNKISGAEGYRLYRYNPSTNKYDNIKDITSASTTSYTDTSRNSATTYYYKIRSFWTDDEGTKTYSNLSTVTSTTTTPKQTTGLRAIETYTNRIDLYWSKVTGATGYKIYKSSSSSGNYKLIGTTTSTLYKDKNVSKNKTYYYKIRAYKTLNSKNYYGSYSSYLKAKAVLTPITKRTATINATSANVRSNAGTGFSIVANLKKGYKISPYAYKNDLSGNRWYKIMFTIDNETYKGYVIGKYIKF